MFHSLTNLLSSTLNQEKKSPPSSTISKREDSIVAYVPDLPTNIDSNESLENMIGQCLELKHKQKVLGVKCITQLGIGIIYLHSDEDKHNVIHVIEKIIIEPSSNTTVSFEDELELISYIVIDTKAMKNLPSLSDIRRRWVQLYKVHSEPQCEQLSVQFPNIFRIVTHSLDELMKAVSVKEFSINNQFATVYFRADCCFFEDLPRNINVDRLKEAISRHIPDQYMSKELIHIQCNKDGANAVVLTSGKARIWSLHKSILLDGREIQKKDSLACRLLVRSVPEGMPTSLIRDHKIFAGSIVKLLPSSEHVILELSDRSVYEKCLDQGIFRIDEHLLGIEPYYTLSINPKDSEIDAETWYETDMCDCLKPDIMSFITNPQHPIFRWKWNSQAFQDQFRRWTSNNRNVKEKHLDKDEKLYNHKRHLLRMTVMLNTIGIVKKGYYRVGEKEMKLKPDQLKTILYDHKSKLQPSKTLSLSDATKYPYSSTTVKVVNEDCLIVYKKLVSEGYRPVILNMANANSPGGGYKRGDGAQEETLFRRSNYYQSLDMTLDDGKATTRSYCNSNCDIETLDERGELYPMHEFGAIYTSGLTVFRLPEETGYTLMDIPMYDVCAIAMAAYRDPKIDNKNLLQSKYSIGTRKKIENIFSIAYQHKHDCLVLSALGCGAFRNPPTHIATIFKSVIEQYAGYFKCIYFSIIDDHNTGQDFNPHGNFLPFQNVLDHLEILPKREKIVDMMIGPWKILNQTTDKQVILSDIRIYYLTPCHHGGKCDKMKNDQHCREYSHPSLCPFTDNMTSCKEKIDDQHMLWFRHRQKCSYGGECQLIENNPDHINEFEHPVFCHDGGRCENMESEHLKSYRHVPLCRHRYQCVDYNRRSIDHCQKFRHCIPMCRFGHFCVRFHDEKHLNEEKHPFQPPCPFTPFHCRQYNTLSQSRNIKTLSPEIQNHCSQYSHVCRFGRQCHETADIHWKCTIHIARHNCPDGDQCRKTHQEEHLNSFSHPGIADIRRLCQYQGYECRDRRKVEHIKQYRHHGNHDRSGVINCFGQNKQINFVKNQENIVKAINDYVKNFTISNEVQKLIKSLQPTHRCSEVIFESILVHGHVMSREHMEHLKKSSFVAQVVQEHKRVRSIFDRYKMVTLEGYAKEYIRALVSREYKNKYSALVAVRTGPSTYSTMDTSDKDENTIRLQERILKNMLKPEEMDTIKKCAIDISEASWNLHHSPSGLGHPPDQILGTNKHVFSILGPNLGHYYGDIFLVFKSELMLHPDANFSPQAGISFLNGQTFSHRPWTKDPGNNDDRVKRFHQSKLHCSIQGYEYAAAAELAALTGSHKKTIDVHVKDIFNRWKKTDSHEVFEAHLPQLVPLDYIEEVYIPKNIFHSLTAAAQESAKKIFRDSLHITEHEINLTTIDGGGPRPGDKSRADYQDYVVDKLIDKFEKRMERTNHFYGTVMTLAPSQFMEHIILPLRIHDAYNQYHQTHNSDTIYIYWQAMYGDMMITLSDEQINPNISQPDIKCLVCYIAERPSTTTTINYNESYSYLNVGDPYRHSFIMTNGRCSKSSRSFHRACNMEDFLTYCLKLEKKTGEVTLLHAGSNGIYCYETISCKFPKTTLDLNKLNYIHVSAGSQKVPIRNLIVSFEQISDLHPSFDKNFKRGDTTISQTKPSQIRDQKSSPETKEASEEKSPSVVRKVGNAIAGFLGYDIEEKKLEPCPNEDKCRLQESTKHIKEYSHPCPYREHCRNKDKEPHLTHEPYRIEQPSSKGTCQTLDDPTLFFFLDKPSHSSSTAAGAGKSSSDHEGKDKIPCRHGSNCRDQNNTHHCSNYSHPHEHGLKSNQERIPCRHGVDCRDQNNSHHCSKYSHPHERGSQSSTSSLHERTACRHGRDCRDKNDSQHCLRYSHPNDQRKRDDKIICSFGQSCFNTDPHHRAKYAHPNK